MGSEEESSPQEAQQNGSSKMPRLQVMLMIVTAICFLVNALVSLSHEHGPKDYNEAVHMAMEEFMRGMPVFEEREKVYGSYGGSVKIEEKDASFGAKKIVADTTATTKKKARIENCKALLWENMADHRTSLRRRCPLRQKRGARRQYMTFEPDGGGWNNIRMAMETVVGLAIATGRTLVLPPQKKMYLLGKGDGKQKKHFDFDDFFPMKQMAEENDALEMITMKEFLESEAMTGNLLDKETHKPSFPPNNRTDWDGLSGEEYDIFREWLRTVALVPMWRPGQCLATFPSQGNLKSIEELTSMQAAIHNEGINTDIYIDHPVAVDSEPLERMKENLAGRKDLCVYNETMQSELIVHFACYHKLKLRLLVHFYAFLFMEDWKEDLWMKRFMRDHMRYKDEIQCAAARVVHAMRKIARESDPTGNPDGQFDTFHIRRGDFQFKKTRIDADEIYRNSQEQLKPNSTIFIATDERDKKFFDPLRKHYNVWFLDDFKDALEGVNSNYFGMIDQLVASRGKTFFGCWFSTFTGFITRIRGYNSQKDKLPGYEQGVLPSTFYYAVLDKKFEMTKYYPMRAGFFHREFPTSWRDIDEGIDELELPTTA